MNKKIINLLLVFSILSAIPYHVEVKASNELEGYINVEYTDSGEMELLNVIKKDDYLFVNAKEFFPRFGFEVNEKDNKVVIINENNKSIPKLMLSFFYNSYQCDRLTAISGNTYKSPVQPIKNENGVWVPLNYSLRLLNGEGLVVEDKYLIIPPQKTILDALGNFHNNFKEYLFDYSKDYNLSKLDELGITNTSHLINVANGVLSFDVTSWLEVVSSANFINNLLGNTPYANKYGDQLAILVSTYADEEFEEVYTLGKDMMMMCGYGKILYNMETASEKQLINFFDDLDAGIEAIKKQNLGNYSSNIMGRRLDDILKNKNYLKPQIMDGAITAISSFFDILNHINTFNEQDKFSLNSLDTTLKAMPKVTSLSNAAILSMKSTVKALNTNWLNYSVGNYLVNNIPDLILEGLITSVFPPASLIGLGWSLISGFVPVVSNALEASDKVELSKYAIYLHINSLSIYADFLNQFNQNKKLDSKSLYKMSQYAYTFLKSAYIARESSIAMFENILSNKDGVSRAYEINDKIVKDIAWIRKALENNDNMQFGMVDSDINNYKKNFSDKSVMNLFKEIKMIDPFSEENLSYEFYGYNGAAFFSSRLRVPQELIDANCVTEFDRIIYTVYEEPEFCFSLAEGDVVTLYLHYDEDLLEEYGFKILRNTIDIEVKNLENPVTKDTKIKMKDLKEYIDWAKTRCKENSDLTVNYEGAYLAVDVNRNIADALVLVLSYKDSNNKKQYLYYQFKHLTIDDNGNFKAADLWWTAYDMPSDINDLLTSNALSSLDNVIDDKNYDMYEAIIVE